MSEQMEPQLLISVLEDGRLMFGDAEMRLLDAIGREGTLTEGAAALSLSYRVAWGKLRAMESSLGARLIETTVGGRGGGSSRLTPTAEALVSRYTRFRAAVGAFALDEFEKCFGKAASCSKLVVGSALEGNLRDEALNGAEYLVATAAEHSTPIQDGALVAFESGRE
jgi:molybdate transport system regulatory protein